MRSLIESLHQAVDPAQTLHDVVQELITNLGVDAAAASRFETNMTRARIETAGCLLHLTEKEFSTANDGALNNMAVTTLRMCLGSASHPSEWFTPPSLILGPPDKNGTHAATAPSADFPGGEDATPPTEDMKPVPTKGGSLAIVSEMLQERRPYLLPIHYYPPPSFDKYHHSIPRGDDRQLRNMIVQEIQEVCGDLYPDANERTVILDTIEQFVGPPKSNAHWNNYKDPVTKKKHKGTAISDLERARRKPQAYGVSSRCVPNTMRPSRPHRAKGPPPSHTCVQERPLRQVPHVEGTPPAAAEDVEDGLGAAELDDDLVSAEALRKQVEMMKGQLEALNARKSAANAAKKAANAAKNAAKRAEDKQGQVPAAKRGKGDGGRGGGRRGRGAVAAAAAAAMIDSHENIAPQEAAPAALPPKAVPPKVHCVAPAAVHCEDDEDAEDAIGDAVVLEATVVPEPVAPPSRWVGQNGVEVQGCDEESCDFMCGSCEWEPCKV